MAIGCSRRESVGSPPLAEWCLCTSQPCCSVNSAAVSALQHRGAALASSSMKFETLRRYKQIWTGNGERGPPEMRKTVMSPEYDVTEFVVGCHILLLDSLQERVLPAGSAPSKSSEHAPPTRPDNKVLRRGLMALDLSATLLAAQSPGKPAAATHSAMDPRNLNLRCISQI